MCVSRSSTNYYFNTRDKRILFIKCSPYCTIPFRGQTIRIFFGCLAPRRKKTPAKDKNAACLVQFCRFAVNFFLGSALNRHIIRRNNTRSFVKRIIARSHHSTTKNKMIESVSVLYNTVRYYFFFKDTQERFIVKLYDTLLHFLTSHRRCHCRCHCRCRRPCPRDVINRFFFYYSSVNHSQKQWMKMF